MRVSTRGFHFGNQIRNAPARDAGYTLSRLVLRDLYDAGFDGSQIARTPCGVFSQDNLGEAKVAEFEICSKRQEIASAIRYLKASPSVRLDREGASNRIAPANCDVRVDSNNPYAMGIEGSSQE